MSLEHILLSLLAEPASGYDLKREFEAGAATFWPAQLSQIYPTLKRLEARGLLWGADEEPKKGPARRTYVRTEAGAAELERWLRGGPVVGRARFAYLGQLSAMGQLGDPETARSFLVQLRASFVRQLDYLVPLESVILDGHTPQTAGDTAFFDWAALTMGTSTLEARIRHCDLLLELLEKRTATGARRARKSED